MDFEFLLKKSEQNIEAAELLISNKFYASSVHCSYYSCLQLMTYIVLTEDVMTESQLEKSKRSHEDLITITYDFLRERTDDFYESRQIKNKISDAKGSRKRADYQNSEIDLVMSEKVFKEMKEVNAKLVKIFKIERYDD